jgi:hypothetical protein
MVAVLKQGSQEWRMERLGCLTGSRFSIALGGVETRIRLIKDLTAERAALKSGEQIYFDDPNLPNFVHGREWENRAIAEYQLRYFIEDSAMHRPAILTHKKHKWIKYSPDFIEAMTEDFNQYCKLGEIKAPVKKDIHMATLYAGMPPEHKPQVQGGLMVTELDVAVFISYHYQFPTADQLYIQIIERDQPYIATLESACFEILDHVKNGTLPDAKVISLPRLF